MLAEVGEGCMTQPGAAGDWSVKDVMAHLTSYSRWFVNASEAHFRGELPPLDGTEGMDFEQRNLFWYQQTRELSLAEVQAESQRVFSRLLEVVEAHSEEFLTQPQQFEGVPGPLLVWKMLEGDGYEHYREHMRSIRAWLAQSASRQ
ncbi:MAG: ClbS/DfsB family four-helix bundle protein [Chloroflexota bacterium]|nr:ClbS/DfsB family four-helix bundle protein [Chloroflexota bacterium]